MLSIKNLIIQRGNSNIRLLSSIILFLVALLIFLFLNSSQADIEQSNLEETLNFSPCEFGTFELSRNIENLKIINIRNAISFFPEIENIKCYSKVEKLEIIDETLYLYPTTSPRMINIIQATLITLFFIFIKKEKSKTKKIIEIILFVFSILIIFNIVFFNFQNPFFILIKAIFLLLTFQVFDNYDKYKSQALSFFIFLNVFIASEMYSRKYFSNEIYYFKNSTVINPNLSLKTDYQNSFYVYQNLISFIQNIFMDNSKFFFIFLLVFWLSWIINNFLTILNFPKYFGVIGFVFIYNSYQLIGGKETFFGTVVPKVFAFLAIFTALILISKKKHSLFVLFTLIAIYSHFAVAVLSSPIILFALFTKYERPQIIKASVIITFLSMPLLFNIYENNYSIIDTNTIENVIYYITVLQPHHLYPFDALNDFEGFKSVYIYDFLNLFLVVVIAYLINSKDLITNKFLGNFFNFSLIISIFLIFINFYFPFSFIVLLYPFKFVVFLILVSYTIFLDFVITKGYHEKTFFLFIFITLFNLLQVSSLDKKINHDGYFQPSDEVSAKLVTYLSELSPEVILTPPTQNHTPRFADLEYRTQIASYVIYTNPPMSVVNLTEWRERLDAKSKFYNGDCGVFKDFQPTIFIDTNPVNKCGQLIKTIEETHLCNDFCDGDYTQRQIYYIFEYKN